MYKKILGYMRIISVFTLVCAALAAVSICFSVTERRHCEEMEAAAESACFLLDNYGTDAAEKFAQTVPYSVKISDTEHNSDSGSENRGGIFGTHTVTVFANDKSRIILTDTKETSGAFAMRCGEIFILILFLAIMIAVVAERISSVLTENIIRPICDISLLAPEYGRITEIYPELEPVIAKIKAQNHEIERQFLKLRRRKTRFQTVSDNIGEGLLTLDTEGNILSVNKSATVILGVSEDEALHTRLESVLKNDELGGAIRKTLGGNKELITAMIDGRSYNIFFSPVYDRDAVCGIVVLLLDITDRAATEKMRREFTANVSHELKTPLTTILGYSQIIGAGIADPKDINGFAAKIEKEASRLITLINDIIKLSKLDEQTLSSEQDIQPIDMKEIAEETAEQLRTAANGRNVTIEVEGGSFTVSGNRVRLSELVFNLCENAVKYNKDGGSVRVFLHGRTLTVSDTGIGIPEEYRGRIFERFFRVDKSRSKNVNGTGLGLSIVKHIAELYGAEITVESVPDEGTSISVTF